MCLPNVSTPESSRIFRAGKEGYSFTDLQSEDAKGTSVHSRIVPELHRGDTSDRGILLLVPVGNYQDRQVEANVGDSSTGRPQARVAVSEIKLSVKLLEQHFNHLSFDLYDLSSAPTILSTARR
jgi:hypothetical protein